MTGAVGFGSLRFFYGGKYMGNNIRGMLQCLGNPVYGFPCYIVLAALAVCVSSWLGYKGAAGGLLFSLLLCFPAWEDWNTRLISDAWSLALLGLGPIWQPFDWRRLLFSYAVLAAFWLILYACKRGGAGMGDVGLSAAVACWLTPGEVVLFLWFSSAAGALCLLPLYLMKRQREIPFAPFLAAGGIMAYVWGQQIISWYISFC